MSKVDEDAAAVEKEPADHYSEDDFDSDEPKTAEKAPATSDGADVFAEYQNQHTDEAKQAEIAKLNAQIAEMKRVELEKKEMERVEKREEEREGRAHRDGSVEKLREVAYGSPQDLTITELERVVEAEPEGRRKQRLNTVLIKRRREDHDEDADEDQWWRPIVAAFCGCLGR